MLMLLGHNALANEQAFDFIYSFHMALFFILSGYFASSKPVKLPAYLKKNVKGILLPYVVFYLLTLPFGLFVIWAHPYNHPYNGFGEFILKPLIGMFTVETTPFAFHTNGPSWFFVALFFVKLIFYIPKCFQCSLKSLALTTAICLVTFMAVKSTAITLYARMDVALMAFPLYVFGYILNRYIHWGTVIKNARLMQFSIIAIILFVLCYFMGIYNGHVEFSAASYGNSLALMYMTAIIGTLAVFCLSHVICNNKQISTLGKGTAVILGLHSPIQQAVKEVVALIFNIPTRNYSLIIAIPMVLLVAALHIPIINLFNKRYPTLIGKFSK